MAWGGWKECGAFNQKAHTGVPVKDRSTKYAKDLDWESDHDSGEGDDAINIRFALERGKDVAHELYGVDHSI